MFFDTAAATQPAGNVRARSGHGLLIWAAVLIPFLIAALSRLPDGPGLDADDYGQYLMHAQALAEGRSYTDIGYIYSPFRYGLGPAAAPPGLPVTLAAIYRVFGPNMAAMRFVMLCFATAFILVAALYFARHDDRRLGMGVALLCGLSLAIAHGSTQLLTDLPFAALVWALIYLVDLPGRMNFARLMTITILGASAVAFRVPGIAVFPALLLFTALHYREQRLRPAFPLLLWVVGFLILAALAPVEQVGVIRFGRVLESDWIQRVSLNAKSYWSVVFESHLHPFPWARANDLFHIVTGVVMAVGLVAWIRGAFTRFGTIFALAYGGMLMFVPFSQGRYLWPLFPFFVFGLLNGVRIIALRCAPAYPQRASAVALGFAMILVVPAMIRTITEPRRGNLMEVPEVQEIVRELRRAPSAGSVRAVFYKPRSFAWATGFPAMGTVGGPAQCLVSELARGQITHVILGSVGPTLGQRDITNLALNRPDLFSETLRTKSFVVYRFDVLTKEAVEAREVCAQLRRSSGSWRRRDSARATGGSVLRSWLPQLAQSVQHLRGRAPSAG